MIEYEATDAYGNTIYLDLDSNISYKFSPEEMEEANYYGDLSLLPWDEEHEVNNDDDFYRRMVN